MIILYDFSKQPQEVDIEEKKNSFMYVNISIFLMVNILIDVLNIHGLFDHLLAVILYNE